MTPIIKLTAVTLIFIGLSSCSKNYNTTPAYSNITFYATLNGANESTPNTTTGSGTSTLVFNNDTKIFTVTTIYSGLTSTATGGHIHRGAVGISGPVIFPFSSLNSPISYTSVALDATQEADLKAGLYYVNLHTTLYLGGEIRGQLIKQ